MTCVIVLQRMVPICRKRTWQDSDVAKDRFKRLVEDIGHLVLEILRCNERVKQTKPRFALAGLDLASSTSYGRVGIEGFPEMVERLGVGLGPDIQENAYVGVQGPSKGVEEPAV
jgi:hypothetical protein